MIVREAKGATIRLFPLILSFFVALSFLPFKATLDNHLKKYDPIFVIDFFDCR